MKIYITHSSKFDFKNELYAPIKTLESEEYHFIFPHDETSQPFNSKKLFQNKNCDLVIAEVSISSISVGIELGWADRYNIPIICLHKKGTEVSNSLNIISSHFVEYDNNDLINKVKEALEIL